MNNLPQLTPEQRAAALVKAGEVRTERAQAKRSMKEGKIAPEDALDMKVMQRVRAVDFLESCPGIGPVRAEMIMQRCGISPKRRVAGLGRHQRALLLEELSALS